MKLAALSMPILLLAGVASASPQDAGPGTRLRETWDRAAGWLAGQQQASGAWQMGPPDKQADSPSYTALIVTSLANAPKELKAKYADVTTKAAAYLIAKANEDGSFGEGPKGAFLKTYTTALCLMALSSLERSDKISNLLRGAQAYLKNRPGQTRGGSRPACPTSNRPGCQPGS